MTNITYVPGRATPAKGLVVFRDDSAYSLVDVEFVQPDSWQSIGTRSEYRAIPMPEAPELEYFGVLPFSGENRYLIRTSRQLHAMVEPSGSSWNASLIGSTTMEGPDITYKLGFVGIQPVAGYSQFLLLAVGVDEQMTGYGESQFVVPGGSIFETPAIASGNTLGLSSGPDIGISLRLNQPFTVNSGLWGSKPRTFVKYTAPNVSTLAGSVTDLLTSKFTNYVAYSQKRGSITFYDILNNKKLYTLHTGNVRLIGEVSSGSGPAAQFT